MVSGMRVNECVTLRVQDVDLNLKTITLRNTKGRVARVVCIPEKLMKTMEKQLINRKALHIDDLNKGWGYVDLPNALAKQV